VAWVESDYIVITNGGGPFLGYPALCAQARLFFAKKKLIRPAWLQLRGLS
jgi:hypothetical protein